MFIEQNKTVKKNKKKSKQLKIDKQIYLTIIFYFFLGMSYLFLKTLGYHFGFFDKIMGYLLDFAGTLNEEGHNAGSNLLGLVLFSFLVPYSYTLVFRKVSNKLASLLYKILIFLFIFVVVLFVYFSVLRFQSSI